MFTPLQRFFRMLHPNQKEIIHLYIFSVTNGLIALSLPLGIQAIINLIQGGEISAAWVVLVTIVILGYLLTGALQLVQLRITENLQRDIFARSAFEFAYRVPRIKMKEMNRYYAPELLNRFFDTITIQKGVAKILLEFTTSGLQIMFGLILLSLYHSFFVIFSVLVVFLVYIIGNYIFKRGLRSSIQESKYKYKVAFWLEELARTYTTFKLEQSSSIPLKNTDELVYSYLKARNNHFTILLRQYYLFIVFKILVAAGFLVLGGILVFNQQMNIGQFVAAEIIVLLLVQSSEKMLLSLESIYDLLTSIEKIGEVTDLELEEDTRQNNPVVPGNDGFSLTLSKVTFKYPDGEKDVLKDINFIVGKNGRIGITGMSGSGKITLIKLLLGFYKPNDGNILWDGLPMDNFDIVTLREKISACYSETKIFDGTLLENLTMGMEVDEERLFKVLDIVRITPVLATLPKGLGTSIGPHGLDLPGSFIQKIILARCILKKARLYIMEDILKNVPIEIRKEIFRDVLEYLPDSTVILISKDTEILQSIPRIMMLEDGNLKPYSLS